MNNGAPRFFEFFRAGKDRQGAFARQLSNPRSNFSHSPKMISLCCKRKPVEAKRDESRRAPSLSWLLIPSERQTQRELNQPRRSGCREDFSEARDRADMRQRRIREIGMVPDVEEVRGEAKANTLRQLEILQ